MFKFAFSSFIFLLITTAYASEDLNRTEITENDEYRSIVVGKGPIIPEQTQENIQIQTDDLQSLCRDPHFEHKYCYKWHKYHSDGYVHPNKPQHPRPHHYN